MRRTFIFIITTASGIFCHTTSNKLPLKNDISLWDYTLSVPQYLKTEWGGYQIYDKANGKFVDAPETDQKILRDYPYWIDKGPLTDSTRITITTAKLDYKTGEAIRIGHIVEETGTGRTLYVMGPKTISEEFVNDSPPAPLSTGPQSEYPWLENSYDGEILPSPGYDYNFEITEYHFNQPGTYRIQWKPGKYHSNILTITVTQ